jgi:RNA polymerase I-specific transcription initiation factor RRN3
VTASTSRQTVQRRAHHTLQYITRLIPTASTVLAPVVIGLFPHPADSRRAHIIYVRNLLQITEYASELESEILALITERMVKIDVQVQHAVEDLAEELGERVVEAIGGLPTSAMDLEDEEDESDDESDLEDDDIDEEAQRAKEITRDVEKLDIVLDLLFAHYSKLMASPSIDKRDAAIDNLLSQFSNTILPTYHSRHTQFLLFHFAQTSPELVETFVSKCILLTRDLGRPALLRQSAAAYLASFVARGVHVPAQIVRDVFDVIGDQLSDLRHDFEPSCRGPDLRRYSIYYSLVQALLYIFCFRWRDLEAGLHEAADGDDLAAALRDDDDAQHIWIPGIKDTLSSNIFSPLNPLKVCSSSIVSEFAKIAHHVGILYVYHLIETNKRLRLITSYSSSDRIATGYNTPNRETALTARMDDAYAQLDPYFPFDPYQLPRSKQWIDGDYREWTGIPGVHDRGVVDSDSEDDDEVDSELDEEQATGTDGDDDDLD